ncbi:MAG: hypothetical protein M3P46_09205, partial [Actinomycetota bacterium]|nr:hypothetical protein [Actinomycetota bacterium]
AGRPVPARDHLFEVDVDVVRLQTPTAPLERARLLRLVRRAAGLSVPSVVRVLDAGEQDGAAWLVLPRSGRGTLADQLAGKPVQPDLAVQIALNAVDGALALRAAGLAPFGLLPEHLALDGAGHVQVLPAAPYCLDPLTPEQDDDDRDVEQIALLLSRLLPPGEPATALRKALRRQQPYPDLRSLQAELREAQRQVAPKSTGSDILEGCRTPERGESAVAPARPAGVPAVPAPSARPPATATGSSGEADRSSSLPARPSRQAPEEPARDRWVHRALVGSAAGLVLLAGAAAAYTSSDVADRAPRAATAAPSTPPAAGGPSPSAATPGQQGTDVPSTPPASSGPRRSVTSPGPDATTEVPRPVTTEQDLQNLIAALKAQSTGDRPTAGQDARKVLKRLREAARLEGAAQDNRAIALNENVRAAVRAGRLDAQLGRRTSQVLDRVTAPPDLVALVRLALHDPSALGSAGDELTRRLYALDHRTGSKNVPPAAAATLTFIRKGVGTGALVPAVGRAADPVLKPLARPEPLRKLDALIAELRRDPRAAGPDGRTVLSRLQSLETLTVYRRTFEARALTGILRDGPRNGGLTTTFRDRALPVLQPLAQQQTSGSSSAQSRR